MSSPDLAAACAGVRSELAGLDGHELSTRRATEIRTHLAGCPDCAEVAAAHRSVRRTLAELHTVPAVPPPGLLDELLAQASRQGLRERGAVLGRGAVSGARPGVIAAGAGIGAVAATGLGLLAWRALRTRRSAA